MEIKAEVMIGIFSTGHLAIKVDGSVIYECEYKPNVIAAIRGEYIAFNCNNCALLHSVLSSVKGYQKKYVLLQVIPNSLEFMGLAHSDKEEVLGGRPYFFEFLAKWERLMVEWGLGANVKVVDVDFSFVYDSSGDGNEA